MATLGTLKPELMAALESIDQQSPVDFLDAETLVDTGLVVFNPHNDYWYELTATGEMQLNKYAAWDELRAENARLRAALENIAHCPVSSGEYGYMVMLYEARRALGIPTPYDNLTDDDIGEDGL